MCFSATASFLASGYLATMGILCLKKNRIPHATLFAAIPLIFALQQATEGLLWLSHTHGWTCMQHIMPYLFLLFAFCIWPMWIPLSLALIEPCEVRRKAIVLLGMIGTILALYLYGFVLLHGITALPLDCHIYYDVTIPSSESIIGSIAYLLATVASFFISSLPIMWLFGLILLLSYWISYIFYFAHLISIWCFFAAVLSGFVYIMIKQMNKN